MKQYFLTKTSRDANPTNWGVGLQHDKSRDLGENLSQLIDKVESRPALLWPKAHREIPILNTLIIVGMRIE